MWKTTYIEDTNTVVLVSLDRELTYANSSKKKLCKKQANNVLKNSG